MDQPKRRGPKSIETRHYEEREAFFDSLKRLDRRGFMKLASLTAGAAAARGLTTPVSYQLVNLVTGANEKPAFTFAYISDTHLYEKKLNDRFVRAILRAVDDVNRLDPQPDFVLFGGDLAQQGPTAGSSPDEVARSKANVQSGHTYGAFSARDEKLWKASLDDAVAEGRAVFHDAAKLGGTVAISCDMCHPDASNTHPETYPKFQVQLGRVAMQEDPRMKAMEAYIYAQRAGKVLEPGKH